MNSRCRTHKKTLNGSFFQVLFSSVSTWGQSHRQYWKIWVYMGQNYKCIQLCFQSALFSFPNCFWQLIPPLFKVAWYIFLELSTTDCYQSVKVQHVVFTWNAFFPPMSTHYSPPPHTHLEVIYEYALTPKELQWRLPCTARKDYAYPLFPIMPHYSDVIAIL